MNISEQLIASEGNTFQQALRTPRSRERTPRGAPEGASSADTSALGPPSRWREPAPFVHTWPVLLCRHGPQTSPQVLTSAPQPPCSRPPPLLEAPCLPWSPSPNVPLPDGLGRKGQCLTRNAFQEPPAGRRPSLGTRSTPTPLDSHCQAPGGPMRGVLGSPSLLPAPEIASLESQITLTELPALAPGVSSPVPPPTLPWTSPGPERAGAPVGPHLDPCSLSLRANSPVPCPAASCPLFPGLSSVPLQSCTSLQLHLTLPFTLQAPSSGLQVRSRAPSGHGVAAHTPASSRVPPAHTTRTRG